VTAVKLCGLTTPEHVRAAAGAHAVGFVVASPRSHRDLSLEAAAGLARLAAPFQATVAVTAAREPETLEGIVRAVQPHALQLPLRAGASTFEGLRKGFPALRLFAACRPEEAPLAPAVLDALVLDATSPDGYGGSGQTTDWGRARAAREASRVPVILAGGLTPENVADAIRAVRPFAVDVSSGVETDRVKDPAKMRRFLDAARRCELA
jgi:phosphoribosylanthranilate isomerase